MRGYLEVIGHDRFLNQEFEAYYPWDISSCRCLGPIPVAKSESLEETLSVQVHFSLYSDPMLDSVTEKNRLFLQGMIEFIRNTVSCQGMHICVLKIFMRKKVLFDACQPKQNNYHDSLPVFNVPASEFLYYLEGIHGTLTER